VDIAKRLKIPSTVIALTVAAMGTSAPELMISVSAAIGGSGDLAVANVVGSNIFNLLFIIGLCALLYPINVNLKEISRDYWVSVAATVFLLVIVIAYNDTIPRAGSFILLAGFVVYMVALVRQTMKIKNGETKKESNSDENTAVQSGGDIGSEKTRPLALSIFLAVLGAGHYRWRRTAHGFQRGEYCAGNRHYRTGDRPYDSGNRHLPAGTGNHDYRLPKKRRRVCCGVYYRVKHF
jgi:Ca2+/Na+ antiporter